GYVKVLEDKNDMESRGRIENVQELKSNILGFLEQDPEDATLSGFLNEIALYTDLDSVEADDNCVTMMTIHSAKGLEFPVVYVVGMEEGIFPGSSAQYDQEELEEERRLCYVAMTRAKEKLTLTNCRQRMLYGRTSANRASRFLEEIPEENMHWESKPERAFGGMEHDATFGGDRWEGGSAYGGYAQRPARPSTGIYTSGGPRENGSVHSYRPEQTSRQRPLASAQRSTAPAADLMQLEKGDMVRHTAFGKGMVLSVRPMGGDALVEVAFDQVGMKKLMLKSAGKHMEKL
ncbi:MAG: ATP-binding domain-containing protein, partial [Oscillospiraceae bacterium]|nr:ATP-binding domain-containing protein [Oscillospiraceae bacterium]